MSKRSSLINWMTSLAVVLITAVVLAVCYDFYYDLNDDVLIKDILGGTYSGTPDGHCIQSYFLLGFPISLLYRLAPRIPWYGGMLWLFQFGSLFFIVGRSLKMYERRSFKTLRSELLVKAVTAAAQTLFLAFLLFEHLINIQYTVTVAIMSGAAIVWILTVPKTDKPLEFIRKCFPAIIIVFLAFLLRSEMLLLMLPFIGLSGLFKWSLEKKFFSKENLTKYLGTFGIIIGFLAVGFLSEKVAYGSSEWTTFTDFFDARTELYDFRGIPPYEGNEDFYDSEGLLKEEQVLLENYNFGIDDKIDGKLLWETAAYSEEQRNSAQSFVERIKENIKLYIYQVTHGKNSEGSDYPWNVIVFAMYLLVGCHIIQRHGYKGLWRLALLFAGRSVIRLYIMMGNRTPDRIMHSLFFIEIVLLFGMLVLYSKEAEWEDGSNEQVEKGTNGNPRNNMTRVSYITAILPLAVYVLLTAVVLLNRPSEVLNNRKEREETNAAYNSLLEYTGNNTDNFYFIDVYSTVPYSEKIFGQNFSKVNYELMGGWACNCPLMKDKFVRYGFSEMEEGLLTDSVFFITDSQRPIEWLTEYYGAKGKTITSELVETIDGKFDIYAITGR